MQTYKRKKPACIIRQDEVSVGVYSLWVSTETAADARPGQFYLLYPGDEAHLLGRPISICEIDPEGGKIRFVYQVKGFGTVAFSSLKAGDYVDIVGPLGNGFPLDEKGDHLLVGGGMGIAPLLSLAHSLNGKKTVVLGYRDFPFMDEAFKNTDCTVITASESGNYGIKGNVLDALRDRDFSNSICYSCGPLPMLRALSDYSKNHFKKTYVSLEERMACGMGACLGCVTPSSEEHPHYGTKKLCICKDGPVFEGRRVML